MNKHADYEGILYCGKSGLEWVVWNNINNLPTPSQEGQRKEV